MSGGLRRAFSTSLGTKTLMAVTGVGLVVFVFFHMLGNLQVFGGPDMLNRYAETLRGLGPLLWVARAGLLVLFVAHVFLGLRLARQNRAARPVGYHVEHYEAARFASRFMLQSGLVVLAFLVYHLLHFTFGVTHPQHFGHVAEGRHDVYRMVILGFRNPLVAASYVVAQVFLGLHLYHGAASVFQTLGLKGARFSRPVHVFGLAVAAVVVAGNVLIVVSVWLFGLGGDYLSSVGG